MQDTTNRTFICSVVFIDLVGYSKKPVTEQIRLKTSLTNNLSEAIKDIPVNDRINVAQRIMSFARPGQIVVSRSYYDVVSNLAGEYAKLFTYEGSRTDKHVREHEIYVVGHHEGALQKARDGMRDRASSTSPNP